MIRGLYTAAAGMLTRQAQQENLSNNIANVNTPGYKSDSIAVKSFDEMLIKSRDSFVNGKSFEKEIGNLELGVGVDETKTSFTQGQIQDTGRNLDFAINGAGFFTVQDDSGNEKYTRDGRFKVSQDGYIVNSEGYRVLDSNKRPIQVKNADFQLAGDGTIDSVNGKVRFGITAFQSEKDIVKDSVNCFKAAPSAQTTMVNSTVKQGSLESSNVDTLDAITQMISVMRDYESNSKVFQAMDETLGKTVNDVGAVK